MVIEHFHAYIPLKFLDRDCSREAVIGAIEANELGEQAAVSSISTSAVFLE